MTYLYVFLAGLVGAALYDGLKLLRAHLKRTNWHLDRIFADELKRPENQPGQHATMADEAAALHELSQAYARKVDELLYGESYRVVPVTTIERVDQPDGAARFTLRGSDPLDVVLFTHTADNLLTHGDTGQQPVIVASNPEPPGLLAELMHREPAGRHATEPQPTAFEREWINEQRPFVPQPNPCDERDCRAGVHFPGTERFAACRRLAQDADESDDEHRDRVAANAQAWATSGSSAATCIAVPSADSETTGVIGFGHGDGSPLDGPECDGGFGCRANLHRPSCDALRPPLTIDAELFEPSQPTIAGMMHDALRNQPLP